MSCPFTVRRFAVLAFALSSLFLSACGALPQARMALPGPLANEASRQPIEGIGGSQQSNFRTGDSTGSFKRSAVRINFFDLVQRDRSAVRFDLAGPDWKDGLKAECLMRQVTVEASIVSFPVKRLAFRCSLESGGDPQGELVMVEADSGLTIGAPRREGRVSLLGKSLTLRAVHGLAGSPFQLEKPSGYVFERDGPALGAVEVTDASRPDILFAAGVSAEERRMITLAALALSMLWEQG
ncbi:MAG: hypothetical protein SF172_16780 [Burkholderiales bacterium]|nr:hypothetical protein [Burkholderiales bacterium]